MKKFIQVFLTCIFFAVFCTGCKTIELSDYIVPGQPDECNDYYITLAVYFKSSNKDFAFPATIYDKCSNARKERINEKVLNCYKLYPDNLEGFAKCIK